VTQAARKLLAHRAYDELKDSLQSGTYPPGSFLSERRLAAKLGMSKTPVKAALVRLETEGFVTISPQQGIVVREPSIHEVVDILDLREALESFVVRRIAGRLTEAQKAELRANLKAQAKAAQESDIEATTRLDAEFHILLCSFLGNREIVQVMERLREKLHGIILTVLKRDTTRMAPSYREHAAIAEAVMNGKGDLAAERIVQHFRYGKEVLIRR
jgi:DNA-binding GntR family transcriptional regulator